MAEKIILFYKYVNIVYPVQIQKWQQKICQQLNLKGKIVLAHEGINGTLAGSVENLEQYKQYMQENVAFADIDFKESEGSLEHFPRLRIVVKKEICHLGLDTQQYTAHAGGQHLTPAQVHQLIQSNKDLVILDARNNYESKIGKFTNAITPDIEHFRQFPAYVDQHLEQFKDKEVLMYCTGGIRCERASTYLKSKNVAKKVYQIEGGIHRYIEQFPDGFFRGKNYVFDGRVAMKVNDDIISNCDICKTPNDDITNCINATCNKQYVACPDCLQFLNNTCSTTCMELVKNQQVVIRTIPKRISCQKQ